MPIPPPLVVFTEQNYWFKQTCEEGKTDFECILTK